MPTNRKRTPRSRRTLPIESDDWLFLSDEEPENPFTQFSPDDYFRQLWLEHGKQITAEFVAKSPGFRPRFWWKYDAPRLPVAEHGVLADCYDSVDLVPPRLQVGVLIKPDQNAWAYSRDRGVPIYCDDDGNEITDDSSRTFETEYAYLKRHGLLLPGERGPQSKRKRADK